jgi:hypothetical protein
LFAITTTATMTAPTSIPSQSAAIVLNVGIPKSRKMSKRKVTWSKKKEYFVGRQEESMIHELVNTIWYTKKEYTAFRKEAQDSKQAIAKGKSCECVRGFEHIVCPQKKALRRTRRQSSVFAVIVEQDEQFLTDSYDVEAIRTEYRTFTEVGGHEAHLRGLEDQMDRIKQTDRLKKAAKESSATNLKTVARFCSNRRARRAISD